MVRRVMPLVLVMVVLAACSSDLVIDADADGTTVTVAVGDTLEVALQGNPSTGFIWEPVGLDETILQWTGVRRLEPESTLVGAAGTMRLTFEALAPGTVTLELVYHRSFETADPEDTFSVTVVAEE